jgi:hypothetical protein
MISKSYDVGRSGKESWPSAKYANTLVNIGERKKQRGNRRREKGKTDVNS